MALIAILIGFLAVLAAMIGALFLDRSEEPIGAAHDPVANACVDARDSLRALGPIEADVSQRDLATRIDNETAILRTMVATFAAADAGTDAGNEALDAWIADWTALLDARDVAADRIAAGERPATWLPPEAPGEAKAIDGRMDEYARREDIRGCTTDVLEADNLEGRRGYRSVTEQ